MQNKANLATAMILLEALIFGVSFAVLKDGLSAIDPFNFLFWRFFLGSLVLVLIFPHKFKNFDLKTISYGLFIGVFMFAAQSTQTIGVSHSTASKGAFITNLCVVLVPIFLAFKPLLLKKGRFHLAPKTIIASLLALSGLAILTLSSSLTVEIGDLWLLACSVFFTLYIILVGHYSKDFDAVQFTFFQLIAVAILSFAMTFFFTEGIVVPEGFSLWMPIIYMAVFATAIVHAIQNKFQRYISENKTAIIFATIPLFATITAYFYLGEEITWRTYVGGALILIAMVFADHSHESEDLGLVKSKACKT